MATSKQTVYTAVIIFDLLCFVVLIAALIVRFGRSEQNADQISGPVPDSVIFTDSDFEEAEEVVFE